MNPPEKDYGMQSMWISGGKPLRRNNTKVTIYAHPHGNQTFHLPGAEPRRGADNGEGAPGERARPAVGHVGEGHAQRHHAEDAAQVQTSPFQMR